MVSVSLVAAEEEGYWDPCDISLSVSDEYEQHYMKLDYIQGLGRRAGFPDPNSCLNVLQAVYALCDWF